MEESTPRAWKELAPDVQAAARKHLKMTAAKWNALPDEQRLAAEIQARIAIKITTPAPPKYRMAPEDPEEARTLGLAQAWLSYHYDPKSVRMIWERMTAKQKRDPDPWRCAHREVIQALYVNPSAPLEQFVSPRVFLAMIARLKPDAEDGKRGKKQRREAQSALNTAKREIAARMKKLICDEVERYLSGHTPASHGELISYLKAKQEELVRMANDECGQRLHSANVHPPPLATVQKKPVALAEC